MPMKNNQLILAIKSEIRKKIKKEAGDWIEVILYQDDVPAEIPEEFILCLRDDARAWENFQAFSEQDQKKYLDWIYSVKTDDLKIERMAKSINKISQGETL